MSVKSRSADPKYRIQIQQEEIRNRYHTC